MIVDTRTRYLERIHQFESSVKEGDDRFLYLIGKVDVLLSAASKHVHLRIGRWLEKMCEPVASAEWKKNRDNYALLLVQQLEEGELRSPFDKFPVDGPLPTFPNHLKANGATPRNFVHTRKSPIKMRRSSMPSCRPSSSSAVSTQTNTDVDDSGVDSKFAETMQVLKVAQRTIKKLELDLQNEREQRRQEKIQFEKYRDNLLDDINTLRHDHHQSSHIPSTKPHDLEEKVKTLEMALQTERNERRIELQNLRKEYETELEMIHGSRPLHRSGLSINTPPLVDSTDDLDDDEDFLNYLDRFYVKASRMINR